MNLLKNKKIGFIGTGRMAYAVIKALLDSKALDPEQIFVSNRSSRKKEKSVQAFGVNSAKNNEDVVSHCDVVFLCMKVEENSLVIAVAEHIVIDVLNDLWSL